ncbi:MAG: porin [Proteobacteria bacterium]|nr:porin [Pseudomonadota bacterium]
MKSVFKLSSSRLALLAAFGLTAAAYTPAIAADLGGDCCADLEERVAELEATTARKGNRKVSLTVSGWVNESVMVWDDGAESNAYVGTNTLEQSRFRFVGEAQIAPGYSAGYTMEIGVQGHPLNKFDQTSPSGNASPNTTDNILTVRKSNWWLKSKDLGKVTVGLEGTALYHVLDDADGANTRNFSDAQAAGAYNPNFFLRHNGLPIGSGLRWSSILQGVDNGTVGQDGRRNIVRYDSPTIAGFVLTASWGEDDDWGMALTYSNKLGDFLVLGKVGYGENSDEHIGCSTKTAPTDCQLFGAAATVMHAPTGLYVYGGYAQNRDVRVADLTGAAAVGTNATSSLWFIQGGIEQKWVPLGKTTLFGEYRHDDGGSKDSGAAFSTTLAPATALSSTSLNFVGAGAVQHIDAAEMDLYVVYRHADGNITNVANQTLSLDAFDAVIMGGLIKF